MACSWEIFAPLGSSTVPSGIGIGPSKVAVATICQTAWLPETMTGASGSQPSLSGLSETPGSLEFLARARGEAD